MGFWSDLSSAAAGNIPKVIGGVIGSGLNEWLQSRARKENYKYNEMAADNADKRQRAQFHDLYSYSAQMKEMQKAGLNPALIYSGGAGGQGGATAPQGSGAGGVQAGYSPLNLMSAAELKVMESQANLNNAQAKNLNQDTTNKGQLLLNLKQENLTEKARTLATQAEAELKGYQASLESINFANNVALSVGQVEVLARTLEKLDNEIEMGDLEVEFNQATFDTRFAQMVADLGLTEANTKQIKMMYGLTAKQIELCSQQISNTWWQTWAIEKQENRADAYFKLDRQKLKEQVQQWLRENKINITKAQWECLTNIICSGMYMMKFGK